MSKSTFLIAAIAIIGMGLCGLTLFFVGRGGVSADRMTVALAAIQSCGKESNAVACSRPILSKLLETQASTEILTSLESHFNAPQCHFIGHVVGQELYIREQDIERSLSMCNRACDSACIHGVIGEAFAERLGLGTPDQEADIDLQHLNREELQTIGSELCAKSQEACHGVGHAVFQATLDMQKAMDLCSDVTLPDSAACYNGVAMEYSDILWSRNMRDVQSVAHPELNGIGKLCIGFSNITQIRSCFRYFPRMVVAEVIRQGKSENEGIARVKKICGAYQSDRLRAACFQGYGAYRTYLVLTNQDEALRVCADITPDSDKAACYYGQASAGVENRQDQLLTYCGKLPDERFQYSCYQTIFSYLYRLEVPTESARKQCGEITACQKGYEERKSSPWQVMQTTFAD